MDAWEDFRMRRKWFVDDFCQPVYEVWLAEAVARGVSKRRVFSATVNSCGMVRGALDRADTRFT